MTTPKKLWYVGNMIKLLAFFFVVLSPHLQAADAAREIIVKTESIGGKVHWVPQQIEVTPGEKVKFVVKHELEGGFNFHGFSIPALKVAKQVDRSKDLVVETAIPKTLKPGEYDLNCQFHPAHVGAKIFVKGPAGSSPTASVNPTPAPSASKAP